MEKIVDAALCLPSEDIARPDAVFRSSCRNCRQNFDVENVPPFTPFECPRCHRGLVVPKIFGDYWLLRRISDAGSSRLYGALDPLLDREIVIKVAKRFAGDDDQTAMCRRRLYYDSQIQAQLDHPDMLEVYRACRMEDRDFKVMELLSGGHLRFAEDPGQRTDPVLALSALAGTASVLETAAQFNVAHGGICAGHLIFNDDGVLKLINFRPPEAADRPVSPAEYGFFAPERLLDFEMTPEADIYSLGVLLYMFLSNRHPMGTVEGLSELELVNRQQRNPVPPLKDLSDVHDDDLFDLVSAMLALHAADRPKAGEVSAGLAAAADRLARRRNLKAAFSRLSRKLQQGLVYLQTGEFAAPDYEEEESAAE